MLHGRGYVHVPHGEIIIFGLSCGQIVSWSPRFFHSGVGERGISAMHSSFHTLRLTTPTIRRAVSDCRCLLDVFVAGESCPESSEW